MNYKNEYELLKKNIWDIMEQLRAAPRDEDSGSWADINTYSVWFTLFQAVSMRTEEYKKAIEDEQKRS